MGTVLPQEKFTLLTLLIKLANKFNKHFKEGSIQSKKQGMQDSLFGFAFWRGSGEGFFVDEQPFQWRQDGWIWIPSIYFKALSRKSP